MNLDAITVAIRPRSAWEAIDAGFMLARRWYWKLFLLWMLAASPFLLLLCGCIFLLSPATVKWFLLLFWLFKPFYELPILNWISKSLFGEKTKVRTTFTDVRKKLRLRTVFTLLFSRFSPFRSFSMPVLHLEGLKGSARKQRLALLANNSETAFFLTASGFCIEMFLALSLMSLLYWLLPENLRWVDFGRFIFRPENWLLLISYILSCAVFAPFYTCAGFMMYISRRVELEAWDIEIGFKQMGQRLSRLKNGIIRTTPALILFFIVTLSTLPGIALAAPPDPDTAQKTISTVLEGKEFGHKTTIYYWVPKEKIKADPDLSWLKPWEKVFKALAELLENVASFLANSGKLLLWVGAGIVLAFLLAKYFQNSEWLGGRFGRRQKAYTPPEVMFGMDLRPESLPDDIGASCLALLEKGRKREALSLLYRGTLSRLVNLHSLEIHASFTEAECCDQVRGHRPETEGAFFASLTELWVCLAYAHRNPDGEDCRRLVTEWDKLYGVQA